MTQNVRDYILWTWNFIVSLSPLSSHCYSKLRINISHRASKKKEQIKGLKGLHDTWGVQKKDVRGI